MIPMENIQTPRRQSSSSATFASTTVRMYSIVFALTGFSFLYVDACAVNQCYESLIAEIGFVDHQLVFPFYEDDELNLLCQVYKKTEPCVALYTHECTSSERIAHQGLDLTIRFLCHDGYEAYRRQRHCFVAKEVIHIAEICNATYITQLNDLRGRGGGKTMLQKTSLLCSHVDELVTCVRDGVIGECGSEAGQLIFSLKTSIQKPVKEGMGCVDLPGKDSVNSEPPIVFIVIVCSLLSVVIILIVAIVYRRLRSRSSSLSSSSFFSSSPDGCGGGRRLRIFGHHFHRSGRLQLMESKTAGADASRTMKVSSVESESSVTLHGTSVMERESTTLSKPLLTPMNLGSVSETDDRK